MRSGYEISLSKKDEATLPVTDAILLFLSRFPHTSIAHLFVAVAVAVVVVVVVVVIIYGAAF